MKKLLSDILITSLVIATALGSSAQTALTRAKADEPATSLAATEPATSLAATPVGDPLAAEPGALSDGTILGTTVSVYTGEEITSEAAKNRPVAVMMPTDKAAQPSYGIGHAKVLYEIMEEGSISRQLAIIDDWHDLDRIGNIRSCREYYIHVATEWDPILIHFGGVVYLKNRITQPDIDNLSGVAEYGVGGQAPGTEQFFRTKDRSQPHNAYISAKGIKTAAEKLGYSLENRPQYYCNEHFKFADEFNTLEQYDDAGEALNIDLSKIFPYTKSSLTYDEASGLYLKNLHGKAQVDAIDDEQLAFANVIIQSTSWKKVDKKGYLAFDILGSGEGYYCTAGRVIHVRWEKHGDHQPTRYYDDLGNEILLNKGKTYIAIAQKEKEPIFS